MADETNQNQSAAERLAALGLTLPPAPAPAGLYSPARRAGGFLFTSGVLPPADTKRGKLGGAVTVEEGAKAAEGAALALLALLEKELGSLDLVESVVKLTGFVASEPGFTDQPKVMNGASGLFVSVFGEEAGKAARSAVGVASLPFDMPVEVELIVKVRQ